MAESGGVFLGYLHPNEVPASFHRSLMDLVMYDQKNSGNLRHWGAVRAAGYGLPEARNTVVEQMLASECEWLFFLDADMGFEPWILDQLLLVAGEQDLKLLGGLAFIWKEAGFDGMNGIRNYPLPTIYDFGTDPTTGKRGFMGRAHYPVNELVRTAATGCACVLIHRSVLEGIHEKYGPIWFDRIPQPDDPAPYGEDISFFVRAATLEVPVFVHTGIRTTHFKSLWVAEEDFWNKSLARPADQMVDVIVPTVKARAGNIPQLAATLKASTGMANLLLVVDDEEHAAELEQYGRTTIFPGSFAKKINAAYPHTTAPWIQVVGDDCRFHPGWLDQQQQIARLYSAKVVGSNDLANPRVMRGEHATHWMIARDYIDERGASWDGPGVVAHEGYKHWFVDDEIVTVARLRGVYQMALGAIIEHLHPITGKVESDEVYERNDRFANKDRELFQRRVKKHAAA